jgi:hypothetical protein
VAGRPATGRATTLRHVTDLLDDALEERPQPPRRTKRTPRGRILAVVVLLAVVGALAAGTFYVGSRVLDRLSGSTARTTRARAAARSSSGRAGDTAGDVADTLVEQDVVASRAAFFDVAAADPALDRLQPGSTGCAADELRGALELLLDPSAAGRGTGDRPRRGATSSRRCSCWPRDRIPLADFQAAAAGSGRARPAGVRAGQPRGLPVPGHLRGGAGAAPARRCLTLMIDRFEQAAETSGSRRAPSASAARPYESRDRRQPHRARGEVRRRVRPGLPRRLQPARPEHPARHRRRGRLRVGKAAGGGAHQVRPGRGHAVREPAPDRAAAHPHRLAGEAHAQGCAEPRGRATSSTTCWRPRRVGPSSPTTTRPSSTSAKA